MICITRMAWGFCKRSWEPGAGSQPRKALTCGDVVADPLDGNAGVFDRLAKLVHHHPFDAPVDLKGPERGCAYEVQRTRTDTPPVLSHLSAEPGDSGWPSPPLTALSTSLTSLGLSFLICEMRVTVSLSRGGQPRRRFADNPRTRWRVWLPTAPGQKAVGRRRFQPEGRNPRLRAQSRAGSSLSPGPEGSTGHQEDAGRGLVPGVGPGCGPDLLSDHAQATSSPQSGGPTWKVGSRGLLGCCCGIKLHSNRGPAPPAPAPGRV